MANKFLDYSDSCEVLDRKIATRFLCEYNNIETCLHTLPSAQVTLAECCYSIDKKSRQVGHIIPLAWYPTCVKLEDLCEDLSGVDSPSPASNY
jgi:hypothetical protein